MDADYLLIHRMKNGDDTAIETFVRKYYPVILRYCHLHIRDYGYAEDATQAGVILVSVLYWGGVLICTLFTLGFCGFDGGNCAIQFDWYRSFYNLTYWETYLLYAVSCYIGILFMMFLCMWVSAKTRNAVFATTIPFILIFVPNFFANSDLAYVLSDVLALLPDKLFDLGQHLKYFDVYDLGFAVVGAWPLLFVIYSILAAVLIPVMYREFRTKQIG